MLPGHMWRSVGHLVHQYQKQESHSLLIVGYLTEHSMVTGLESTESLTTTALKSCYSLISKVVIMLKNKKKRIGT